MLDKLTPRRVLLLALLMMLFALAFTEIGKIPTLMQAKFNNPDSFYKLVLVREYSPATGFQYIARDNAPAGMYQHWSSAHTWTLQQLSQVLRQFGVPLDPALLWAGAAITLFSMLALAVAVAKLVGDQGSVIAAIVAVIVLITSGPLRGYGQLIQITHHIFMLVPLATAAIVLLPSERPPRHWNLSALFAGGLIALSLWISPETMPLVVALLATRLSARMQIPSNEALWPIALGLCITLLFAWWQDPPPPTFTAWALDHVSLAWLEFAFLIAVLLVIADVLAKRPLTLFARLAILTGTSLIVAAVWVLSVPNALQGPSGLIPAELKALWWNSIHELKSVESASEWMAFVFMPAAAGMLMMICAIQRRLLWMLVLAISVSIYAALSATHIRMGPAAGLLAAICYGVGLAQIKPFRDSSRNSATAREQSLVLFLIFIPIIQLFMVLALDKQKGINKVLNESDYGCQISDIAGALNSLPTGVILGPVNDTPELLWRTHHKTIAGNYHHNIQGLLDLFHIWRSSAPDEQAKKLIDERGIDYFLVCANEPDPLKLKNGQRSLAVRMTAGDKLDWLAPPQKIGNWWLYRRAP